MDFKDNRDEFYSPPPKLSKGEQIMQFLWNSETNQFLGRTAGSWARILVFYFIFYVVLSIYWGGLWLAFEGIAIRRDKPRYMQKESLIGSNPGLGYRPMPDEKYVESALIWYKFTDHGYVNWTTQLQEYLKAYNTPPKDEEVAKSIVDCNYHNSPPPGKVCRVPMNKMSTCNQQYYNYDKGSPCIFLKLNRIFNWVPQFYNETKDLPTTMPKSLKQKIEEIGNRDTKELNTIWVSCEGENAADKEHIGAIHMFPYSGFPGYYFPFQNTPGYLSPLVAVWFERPARGVLINIECKAWAKNIIYDRHERRGSVHFELMIDE